MLMLMTTNASVLDRTFEWLLDREGDLYGDEQERLRWYEASSAVLGIQTILVTWAVAVAVFIKGREAAETSIAVLIALYAPLVLLNRYVEKRHVRTLPDHWSSKRIFLVIMTLLPYGVAIAGILRALSVSDATLYGFVTGLVVGLLVGIVVLVRRYRLERAREVDEADVE